MLFMDKFDLPSYTVLQNYFVNELRKRSFSEKDILELSTTFFLSWQKSLKNEKELTSSNYEKAIQEFLEKLDKRDSQ
ncbi:hypothetical protein A2960_02810 [Candidatus Gottesmanbacteria bacterium RIFCSPLOWO2_01_FULL_39_12b]|uniref:Uncharacterized protein n=1 Tax=Candidatus Gottesmanbacteria bacterium RIFCSPLOWO2_01_FULL_39_12b TaxID=1798388 RepID=A0A1F6AQT8_9BACT|nr:MAG: hypothetical protein A2960_02810 [Candidatus Gottesmanbacteria bacterium RIFCSPLOWO2_01_FULL_39_12b]